MRLWRAADGKEVLRLDVAAPRSVAFSPDGTLLATGREDGKFLLWELPSGKKHHTLPVSALDVQSVVFSQDGATLAAGVNGLATLWDVATGKRQLRLWGVSTDALAFSRDAKTLATGGSDCSVRLWDVATGKETSAAAGHQGGVAGVTVSSDGKVIGTSGYDREVRLWDADSGRELRRLDNGGLGVFALSPDGRVVACEHSVWDATTGKLLARLSLPWFSASVMAFCPDGRAFAAAS